MWYLIKGDKVIDKYDNPMDNAIRWVESDQVHEPYETRHVNGVFVKEAGNDDVRDALELLLKMSAPTDPADIAEKDRVRARLPKKPK